jgi:hypothetical protein
MPKQMGNRSRSYLNNSQNKMLTSRNFSRRREHDEDLRQSSMSSNNSLYKNPGFESVNRKIEQGKLLPYNYSEKKVIVRKASIGDKEKYKGEKTLTTSQFSKLYRKELDSSTSVVNEMKFIIYRERNIQKKEQMIINTESTSAKITIQIGNIVSSHHPNWKSTWGQKSQIWQSSSRRHWGLILNMTSMDRGIRIVRKSISIMIINPRRIGI